MLVRSFKFLQIKGEMHSAPSEAACLRSPICLQIEELELVIIEKMTLPSIAAKSLYLKSL